MRFQLVISLLMLPLNSPSAQTPARYRIETVHSTSFLSPFTEQQLRDSRAALIAAGGDLPEPRPRAGSIAQTLVTTLSVTYRDSAGGTVFRANIDSLTFTDHQADSITKAALGNSIYLTFTFFARNGEAIFLAKDSVKLNDDARIYADMLAKLFRSRPTAGKADVDTTILSEASWQFAAPRIAQTRTISRHFLIDANTAVDSIVAQHYDDPGAMSGSDLSTKTSTVRRIFTGNALANTEVVSTTVTTLRILAGGGATLSRQTDVKTLTRIQP